jgi:hypothetical protein
MTGRQEYDRQGTLDKYMIKYFVHYMIKGYIHTYCCSLLRSDHTNVTSLSFVMASLAIDCPCARLNLAQRPRHQAVRARKGAQA